MRGEGRKEGSPTPRRSLDHFLRIFFFLFVEKVFAHVFLSRTS